MFYNGSIRSFSAFPIMNDDRVEPPPTLLERLRGVVGYTWDESREAFHSSYDVWHVFGKKHVEESTSSSPNSSPAVPLVQSERLPPPYGPGRPRRHSILVKDHVVCEPQNHVAKRDVEVMARVSVHVLGEEQAYHICKTLVSTVDAKADHVLRPLDIMRLPNLHKNDRPKVVSIFEDPGPNYLSRFIDYGPAWYMLQWREEKLHRLQKGNFVPEAMPLETFLDFAVGAAECVEMLHGQQIVHGEIRGDAFHMEQSTGRVRLVNLGAGQRSFEHGLTSTGWSTTSKELGVKVKMSYMSPEQTGRMPVEPDSRTDIFSLGILFRTILLGKPAFEGETPLDIIQAVLGQHLPSVSNLRPDIPQVIGRIIQKATTKTVSERYHSMSGLRRDLVEVRGLLRTGETAELLNWQIAKTDISPFFTLPEIMVGRSTEHDTIVRVIEHAFKARPPNRTQDKHSAHNLPSLTEGQLANFDARFMEGDASPENDIGSSADGMQESSSMADGASSNPKGYRANSSRLRSPSDSLHSSTDGVAAGMTDSDLKSTEKRSSKTPESLSVGYSLSGGGDGSEGLRSNSDSLGSTILRRNSESTRIRGRCEVITIAGAAGLGKSRLLQSVQMEARKRGYFASTKFGSVAKGPFGPVLKLLSSLFEQAFSESNVDPGFHHILKQYVTPVWPMLHKVLGLPKFLLGPDLPIRSASQTSILSKNSNKSSNKSPGAPAKDREGSPSSKRSNSKSKNLGAQSSRDFLRIGTSTKSLPLMSTFLDILRIFSRHKLICFSLDDFHFADEESQELIAQIISTRIKMVIILTYTPESMSSDEIADILDLPNNEETHRNRTLAVTPLMLEPLSEEDVMKYVAATLCRPIPVIFPLGAVIHSKTAGNPFYVREMLEACHRKKIVWFDYQESGWSFDLDRAFDEFKAENYNDTFCDDFVIDRLDELPPVAKSMLSWAAMLGPSFSFQLVQKLLCNDFTSDSQSGQREGKNQSAPSYSERDTVKGLQAAIQAYIVVPTQDDDIFHFSYDRYMQAAASLRDGEGPQMHFIMAQTLLEHYPLDDKYRNIISSSIIESTSVIKSSVEYRQSFRKFLLDDARTLCASGVRSSAVRLYASCIELLQDDPWNDTANDVYYEETLQIYTDAAECYLYTSQHDDARRLLQSVSSNAKTAVDKAPAWILQSRMYAQEGDSTGAFEALKKCLTVLDIEVDDDPSFTKCDEEFNRLCQYIQSTETETLLKVPIAEDIKLAAVGAVLVEATSAAFWSDTLTFYQMTLIMVNIYLSSGGFPQAGMGFLHLALIAITRHNMINFAKECGDIALALIDQGKDPYTVGRGGTIYPTFVGHIQRPLKTLIGQLEGALEFATQAGDRISTILNFGLLGNLKFFASENVAQVEAFCTYGCQDIPNWQFDTPGGTMIITIRQACRALQGKTHVRNAFEVMSDEQHNSPGYKSWLRNTVKNSDRPLMLYESIEIAPLFLYGHFERAVAIGNSCLKKINAIWSARNTRFLMFFHALSLAGSIWNRVQEQLHPVYRSQSVQLSSDPNGRSLEAGLQEEISGMAMMMKYFKRRIEQWEAVTGVNYRAWSHMLAAQIAEMEDDDTAALRLYEEAMEHASQQGFIFEEALANYLLGGHLLRRGSRRLAKMTIRESITLYRQFGATGVASHIENEHQFLLCAFEMNHLTAETGIQTDPDELGLVESNMVAPRNDTSQIPDFVEKQGDTISTWQDGVADEEADASLSLHMLDLRSILQSYQLISSVLHVNQLFKTMCEIILQNCKGVASLAVIIINKDQPVGWAIAASGDPSGGTEIHNPALPLGESALVAESVIHFCSRFRERVFLPDLLQDPRFSNVNEAWVARNPTSKSVVAFPILHGDDDKPILGVVYVEGQPNSFTRSRVEVLQLLVTQLAISYSNALTLTKVEEVSAINKSMVGVQKKALSEAIAAERDANIAKAEALRNAKLAEEAAQAKTSFLANISHELRTPLNGVIGNTELLLSGRLPKEQAEMADSIRVSAEILLSLINDILDFSKIEANKMQIHPRPFNANEVVREILRSVPVDSRNKKNRKGVRILEDIALGQSAVYGDPVRLHQVLSNLVSNSLKFTEKGSITIGAKTEWETETAVHMNFWTKDTGIGIAPQQLPKLFKPFTQADASTARKYGGSGLGLSICKSLVEAMGGTIDLESAENVGTCVSFSLTLPKPSLDASPTGNQKEKGIVHISSVEEQPATEHIDVSGIPRSQIRICVAEDNLINQKIAVQFLKRLNFDNVDTYENGSTAVEGIRKKAKEGRPYHIVLMDVQMPELDGYEATKLLRKYSLAAVRGILVIALTASAIQGDKEKCLAAGMNDYLAKPVRLDVLKTKFSQYVRAQ